MQRKGRRVRAAFAFAMAAVWCLLPFSVNAAQEQGNGTENTERVRTVAEAVVPDPGRLGSLTICKYDLTAAKEAGVYQKGQIKATGQADAAVEKVLSAYAVEGVQFTGLRVGDMEVYSKTAGDQSEVQLVYEIPEKLRKILGLESKDAVDMGQRGLKYVCHTADVRHYTATQLSKALQQNLQDDTTGTKKRLEDYLYAYGKGNDNGDGAEREGAFSLPKTDSHGVTKAEGLTQGLYLVAETEVPEMVTDTVDPWFVSLPFTNTAAKEEAQDELSAGGTAWLYDMVCYPKNQTGHPTLDKSVRQAGTDTYGDTATASGGDVLEYTIVSRLPNITSKATYINQYMFEDQLSQGLTYNRDAQIALCKNAEDAGENAVKNAVEIWDTSSDLYTVAYEDVPEQDNTAGGSRMTVELSEKGLQRINGDSDDGLTAEYGSCGGLYLVVYYTATLDMDSSIVLGDEGNPNDVRLTWSRTSHGYSNTLEDRNYVYAYGLDLQKTFSPADTGQTLAGKVQFRLYNATDERYVMAEKSQKDGLYYVRQKTKNEAEATLFTPAADGRLWICGLEGDSYELTEVATADGYQRLKEPVTIAIRATEREVIAAAVDTAGKTPLYVGEIHSASAAVDDQTAQMICDNAKVTADVSSENAMVQLEVINTRGFLLPQTGGRGLYLVTILGVLAAGCGCLLLHRKE